MSDKSGSGNRWEPSDSTASTESSGAAGGSATAELDRPSPAAYSTASTVPPAPGLGAARGWRTWRDGVSTRRVILLAAVMLLLGGVVGFGLGHFLGPDQQVVQQQGQFGPGQRPGGFGDGDRGAGPRDGQQGGLQNDQQNGEQSDTSGADGSTT